MSGRIVYLKSPEQADAVKPTAPAVIVGKHYRLSNDAPHKQLHGLCGGLDYNPGYGRVSAPTHRHCYLWDVDDELTSEDIRLSAADAEPFTLTAATKVITSRFVLSQATLSEPQIINQETTPKLTITTGFEFIFSTSLQMVQLSLLNLVETQRFAMLNNGERYSILTGGEEQPLLYLADSVENGDVLMPILATGAGMDSMQHRHNITLAQAIPEQLAGYGIETLTVLEQYTSFFMQHELPFSQENIWTPVSAPISWGWSIRAAKRHDGDWCIVRQKLLMPTVGHNGLEMPTWEGNQLDLTN